MNEKQMWRILLPIIMLFCFVEPGMAIMQDVEGTQIRLSPPAGFTKASQFSGFMLEEMSASILVIDIPGPYDAITEEFGDAEAAAKQGLTLIEKHSIQIDGRDALLLHASQEAYGMNFLKWIVVFGDDVQSFMVIASFPEEVEENFSQSLKKSVLSVVWDKDKQIDDFEGLTFRVNEAGTFQVAQIMANTVFLSIAGEFPLQSQDAPFVIVGSSLSEDWVIPQKSEFAMERLNQTAYLKDIHILAEEKIEINSLPGISHIAKAIDTETDTEKFLFQIILFDSHGYYLMQGLCQYETRSLYENVFQQIFNSFRKI